MVKVLLFDFDYTLVDSSKVIILCANYALSDMGLVLPSTDMIKKSIGMSLTDTYAFLSGDTNPNNAQIYKSLFSNKADQVVTDNTFLLENVKNTVINYNKKGIYLGIISTKYRYRIESVLLREEILDCFSIIIGGEDVTNHKPNKESIILASQKGNFNLSDVIYIGDSLIDAETAKNANVSFIASLTGVTQKQEFENIGVKHFINHIAELSCYFI